MGLDIKHIISLHFLQRNTFSDPCCVLPVFKIQSCCCSCNKSCRFAFLRFWDLPSDEMLLHIASGYRVRAMLRYRIADNPQSVLCSKLHFCRREAYMAEIWICPSAFLQKTGLCVYNARQRKCSYRSKQAKITLFAKLKLSKDITVKVV